MRGSTRRAACALALALVAAAVSAAGAPAQVGRAADLTRLKISGPAAAVLRADGVKFSAIAPADRRSATISLPIAGGQLAPVALRHEGGVRLRSGSGAISLRALRIKMRAGAKRGKVSALVGKRRRVMFELRGRPRIDRDGRTVDLSRARLSLTRRGAERLRSALGVGPVGAGRFARVRSHLALPGPESPSPPYQPGELGPPPDVLARPDTAQAVSEVELVWHPRDSWLRYIAAAGGPPQGSTASGGAVPGAVSDASACPDRPVGPTPLVYSFAFPASPQSWYDAPSGDSAVYGSGTVRFRRDAYGIDIALASPEVEINGPDSRLIFTFTGAADSVIPTQRAVLAGLVTDGTPSSSSPAPGGGAELGWELVRGDLSEAGEAAFGAYPAGDDWGCVSVSLTTAAP